MIDTNLFEKELDSIISKGIREDEGDGDHSSMACIPEHAQGEAILLVKDKGTIAGVAMAKRIFNFVDDRLRMAVHINDGEKVTHGDVVFHIKGNVHSILKAERMVLNSMQRMSAIATKTANLVMLLEGTDTKLLDTRKTSPGIRALEKWAVRIGGGVNHRFGLYDMILIKDNHIDFAKGITPAIQMAKRYVETHRPDIKIEIEARNLKEVDEILRVGNIHRIMLDNFSIRDTKKAVARIAGKYETETSGGIDETTIRAYGECGVDYISCGALTHTVSNMDLSLKAL